MLVYQRVPKGKSIISSLAGLAGTPCGSNLAETLPETQNEIFEAVAPTMRDLEGRSLKRPCTKKKQTENQPVEPEHHKSYPLVI